MIQEMVFGDQKLEVLKAALHAYAERNRVHAANIANVETPGYKPQEVRFEEDLNAALKARSTGAPAEAGAPQPAGELGLPKGRIEPRTPLSGATSNGINEVEIDREMADLAENTLRYTVAAELVVRTYSGLKSAIRGRAAA